MKNSGIKATSLRAIMFVAVFLLIGISAAVLYYGQDFINKLATEVHNISPASETNSNSAAINKANYAVALNQTYQSQIPKDLSKYAASAGVTIENIDFAVSGTGSATVVPIEGLTVKYAKITLANPVKFTNLIKFVKAIENNLPVMKLTKLNISRIQTSKDSVTVEPLTIEEYVR